MSVILVDISSQFAPNGGDARVADVEAGSLTVTASQGGTAPDR
jgi:hypothetical protein